MSDEQNEVEFEAQLKLEARLERGFARTIKTVLIGQPIPVVVAALMVVIGMMEVCLLSNMPAGDQRDKWVEGTLGMVLRTELYKGMSPASYAQGVYTSDLHEIRDVEHGVKFPPQPADPDEAVQLACPRLWTLFQTAESVVLTGQVNRVALTALFLVLKKHVELVLTALPHEQRRICSDILQEKLAIVGARPAGMSTVHFLHSKYRGLGKVPEGETSVH